MQQRYAGPRRNNGNNGSNNGNNERNNGANGRAQSQRGGQQYVRHQPWEKAPPSQHAGHNYQYDEFDRESAGYGFQDTQRDYPDYSGEAERYSQPDHGEGSSSRSRRFAESQGYHDYEGPGSYPAARGRRFQYDNDEAYGPALYGRSQFSGGPGYGAPDNAGRFNAQSHSDPQSGFDHDYTQWRGEQLRAFDDDYRNWRAERYGKFSDEFNEWRKNRRSTAPEGKEIDAPGSKDRGK